MMTARLTPATRLVRSLPDQETSRLAYIDNLRVAVITGVVVHHAAQAYASGGGGWPIVNLPQALVLRPFLAVNAAFGMGLMFLLAGYFTPHAYDHHGGRGLLHKRLVRLGAPTLIISLGIFLPYTYLTQPVGTPFVAFLRTYLPQPQVGHMWFASLLLACTLGYTAWRTLIGPGRPPAVGLAEPPGHCAILGFTLWVGVTTLLVRLVYPLDHWVSPFPLLWFDPVRLPQYLSLFVLGCAAARRDWLRRLSRRTGAIWLVIGLVAAALLYATMMLGAPLPGALLWTLIETLVCVGLAVGLPTLFREHMNWPNHLLRRLSAASYAVYVTHLLPVLGLQFALADLPLPPLMKFLLVAVTAVPLSFGFAVVLRKLPVLASLMA